MNIEEMSELEIVKYLRSKGVKISILENIDHLRLNVNADTFKEVITEGCIFESEYDDKYIKSTFKIIKLINNPFKLNISEGCEFVGTCSKESNMCIAIDRRMFSYQSFIAECEEIKKPQDYKEYLKTINPELLRSDYKQGYYELVKKYKLTNK